MNNPQQHRRRNKSTPHDSIFGEILAHRVRIKNTRLTFAGAKKLRFVMLVFVSVFAFTLLSDVVFENRRQAFLAGIITTLNGQGFDVSKASIEARLKPLVAGSRVIYWEELAGLPEMTRFAFVNLFTLEDEGGFVYISPTNITGRIFFPLAKRFQVAILLKRHGFYEQNIGGRGFDIQFSRQVGNQNEGLELIILEVERPHWPWLARKITGHLAFQ